MSKKQDVLEKELEQQKEIKEFVVNISRVAKVVKGGRRFSLTALVVVGDQNGSIGIGSGKGKEVPDAIKKATQKAKRNMIKVIRKGTTIPYEVTSDFCSAKVLLKPAPQGTGIIAGGAVRAVMEAAGIQDVLSKSLGSDNVKNIAKAAIFALKSLRDRKTVEKLRGVSLDEVK